jgi:hypothetical protein
LFYAKVSRGAKPVDYHYYWDQKFKLIIGSNLILKGSVDLPLSLNLIKDLMVVC